VKPWNSVGQISLLEDPIDAAFRTFHHANPDVYEQLVSLAQRWRTAGHQRCGIAMLYELVRWERGLETSDDQFRLNNNYRSRYARLIMLNEPDLAGFFDVRQLSSEEASPWH
jgi:hypothetical protein